MNKSIAIIGGAGFIGCNLSNYFINQGYKVLIISRTIDRNKFESDKITFLEIDVNFSTEVIEALLEYENIIWLVNNLVPSTKMDSLIDDFTFNINPMIKIMEGVKKQPNPKRFVFLSSGGTIYGDSPNHIALEEESPRTPISAYGLSKIISEEYINYLTIKSENLQSYILRPSNVYGIHQNLKKPQGIIGYAFKSIMNGNSLELYDGGLVVRDFLHVDDLASAINACLNKPYKSKSIKTYNVGSQQGYTIKEVLTLITKVSGGTINIINKPSRQFDCKYNVLSINKIKHELAWEPKVSLETGLSQVWTWINAI
jgi:UDP-glucose 4-epimerase